MTTTEVGKLFAAGILPGILGVGTNDGDTTHADTMRCLKLMGQEVLPAIREIGAELELTDPFQKAAAATA